MRQRQRNSILAWCFLLAIFVFLFAVRLDIVYQLASFAPYYDDWGLGGALQEYKSGDRDFRSFFKPFNGHFALWRNILQFSLFDLNHQQWDPIMQMAVNAFVWAFTGVFLIAIVRRYFDASISPALTVFIFVVWLFPASFINTVWGVQTHNYFMISFTVMGLWFITSPLYRASWWAGVVLIWAVTLTMGGGYIVAPVAFGVSVIYLISYGWNQKQHKVTALFMFVLSLFCLYMVKLASGQHDGYYAKSVAELLSTMFKSLSYPVEKSALPALIFMLPPMVLAWQVFITKTVSGRPAHFVLLLYAFSVALAFTIGYARGNGGHGPSSRYFDFFILQFVGSFMALLLVCPLHVQKRAYMSWLCLMTAWLAMTSYGVVNQFRYMSLQLDHHTRYKPLQEKMIRDYLINRDKEAVAGYNRKAIPFSSASGLVHFIEKVDQEPIWSADLQVPVFLQAEQNTVFVVNGLDRSSAFDNEFKYAGEDVWGSYQPTKDDVTSTPSAKPVKGRFVSELITPTHAELLIPVTGFIGFPGITIKVVDDVTKDETFVLPPPTHLNLNYVKVWQKIAIKTPANAFRIVAEDNSDHYWVAFAAPRVVGKVSAFTNKLLFFSSRLWKIALLILLLLNTTRIAGLLRPNRP